MKHTQRHPTDYTAMNTVLKSATNSNTQYLRHAHQYGIKRYRTFHEILSVTTIPLANGEVVRHAKDTMSEAKFKAFTSPLRMLTDLEAISDDDPPLYMRTGSLGGVEQSTHTDHAHYTYHQVEYLEVDDMEGLRRHDAKISPESHCTF